VGWATTAEGVRYRDAAGRYGGITAVAVTTTGTDPRVVRVNVRGRMRGAKLDPARLPRKAIVAFDPVNGRRGRCAEARFPEPRCAHLRGGTLRCSATPLLPQCQASGVDAVLACTALQAALAQETYYERNHSYESGACTDLPGMTKGEGSICTTVGTATAFTVTAVNVADGRVCQWENRPPKLRCSP
jgi:hypothetical protein